MRETRGHTGNRRSHHHIVAPRLCVCANCGEYHKRHHVCMHCGYYRGKLVLKQASTQSNQAVVTTVSEE